MDYTRLGGCYCDMKNIINCDYYQALVGIGVPFKIFDTGMGFLIFSVPKEDLEKAQEAVKLVPNKYS